MVSFEEFKKLNIKVAKIIEIKDHPNADRLYLVKVALGDETRELVAGIKKSYKPEELAGKLVVVVENIEPLSIRGVESKGMLLAAQDGEKVVLITVDREISPGSIIK